MRGPERWCCVRPGRPMGSNEPLSGRRFSSGLPRGRRSKHSGPCEYGPSDGNDIADGNDTGHGGGSQSFLSRRDGRRRCEPNDLDALIDQYDLPVAKLHRKGFERLAITGSRETDPALGPVYGAVSFANQGAVINGEEVIVIQVERERHVGAAVLIGIIPTRKLNKKSFNRPSPFQDTKFQRSVVR